MTLRHVLGFGAIALGIGMIAWVLLVGGDEPLRPGELAVPAQAGSSVVLVTLDTTRADALGCYGGGADVTPNLDALARTGVRFSAMQAAAPITLPSHSSMLTGLYPYHHGIRNNGMFALPPEVETLAAVYKRAGYATGAFVSATVLARKYGLGKDFDVYDDDLSQGAAIFQRGVPARRGDVTLGAATAWLSEVSEDTPFFCWIHLYDPHAPYDPPPTFKARFPGNPYTGEVAFADSLVGQLLEFLDQRGRRATTFVSVVADHGEAMGEHGEQTHAILLHQATSHVPWILAGPGVPAGVVYQSATSGVDVAPTLAALVGLDSPNDDRGPDGISVIGASPDGGQSRPIYSETMLPTFQYGWAPLYGVLYGDWQLVRGTYSALYNHQRDPRELADLAANEPTVLAELEPMLAPLEAAAAESDDARLDLSRSEIDQLAALGYLGTESEERPDAPDPRQRIGAHTELEIARDYAARGNISQALAALTAALEVDPTNLSVVTERAQVRLQSGDIDGARDDMATALALDPDNSMPYQMMAMVELRARNPQKALELAELGATRRGAFENLSVLKAQALLALGRADEAERFIDDRLASKPDDPDLLAVRAELYARRDDTATAEAMLRKAVGLDALHQPSRFRLALLLKSTGRLPEAVAVLEDLLRIQPGNPRALAAIGEFQIDDPATARAYLEEAVRLNPRGFAPLLNLGRCYLQLELGQDAEAALRRALEVRPGDPSAMNNLGIAYIIQDRLGEAEKVLRDLVTARPDFVEARNNLALVLGRTDRLAEAESMVRAAIAANPKFLDARLTLASILTETDRAGEAVGVLEPFATGSGADHPEFPDRFGSALLGAGRASDAVPWLERAAKLRPDDGDVLLHYAEAVEAAGRPRDAVPLYERAAQIGTAASRRQALEAVRRLALSDTAP